MTNSNDQNNLKISKSVQQSLSKILPRISVSLFATGLFSALSVLPIFGLVNVYRGIVLISVIAITINWIYAEPLSTDSETLYSDCVVCFAIGFAFSLFIGVLF